MSEKKGTYEVGLGKGKTTGPIPYDGYPEREKRHAAASWIEYAQELERKVEMMKQAGNKLSRIVFSSEEYYFPIYPGEAKSLGQRYCEEWKEARDYDIP